MTKLIGLEHPVAIQKQALAEPSPVKAARPIAVERTLEGGGELPLQPGGIVVFRGERGRQARIRQGIGGQWGPDVARQRRARLGAPQAREHGTHSLSQCAALATRTHHAAPFCLVSAHPLRSKYATRGEGIPERPGLVLPQPLSSTPRLGWRSASHTAVCAMCPHRHWGHSGGYPKSEPGGGEGLGKAPLGRGRAHALLGAPWRDIVVPASTTRPSTQAIWGCDRPSGMLGSLNL